ncbi:flagellar motor switch protein FliG [Acidocella facilis]|uniref:flagellar motor switch protein FliG n=1 Tax=Acidocella facilis TaxID=525 RepID=UPI00047A16FC|nr:FliG C-terminal domain-containing protein [Acidocella facilis]
MTEQSTDLALTNGLTGPERAALVLRELGEETAAAVMKEMDELTVGRISVAMSNLKGVNAQLREDIMLSFASDLGITSIGGDSIKFLSRVLVNALGEPQAKEILDRLRRNDRRSSFQLPPNTDARTLAMQMMHERPQTIALLLAHIPHDMGANLLTYLPEPLAAEALYRFSNLDVVSPSVVKELRDMLEELAMQTGTGGRRVTNLGGAKQTAEILNHFPSAMSDTVLAAIDQRDSKTAEKIRENLFTFVDLGKLTDRNLQLLLREVPADKLAPALRLVEQDLRDRFFTNLSARQTEVLKEELSGGPPIRRSDALAAQSEIVDAALRLAAEGRITISATEEMV